MNDVEENLYPTIFDAPDSTVINFSANHCLHEMDMHHYKRHNTLYVNTIKNYLQVASRITSFFVLNIFEVKYLPQHTDTLANFSFKLGQT